MIDAWYKALFIFFAGILLSPLFFAVRADADTVNTSVTILPAETATTTTSTVPTPVDSQAPSLVLPTGSDVRSNGFYLNDGPLQFFDYDYVQASVEWFTDENAQSTFSYGFSPDHVIKEVQFLDYASVHRHVFSSVEPGKTYYYSLLVQDASGNKRSYTRSFVFPAKSSPMPVPAPIAVTEPKNIIDPPVVNTDEPKTIKENKLPVTEIIKEPIEAKDTFANNNETNIVESPQENANGGSSSEAFACFVEKTITSIGLPSVFKATESGDMCTVEVPEKTPVIQNAPKALLKFLVKDSFANQFAPAMKSIFVEVAQVAFTSVLQVISGIISSVKSFFLFR